MAAVRRALVWASDWPWLGHEGVFSYADCVGWLCDWIPDEAARNTILTDTPAELFRFGPGPAGPA